jgi:DNA-binding transcriptional ArsR family regulator
MPEEQVDPLEQDGTQFLVVLQLLRDDHPLRWSRGELERELCDVDPATIGVALERLREHGVVLAEDERVWASACVRHLDTLGFICI